MCAFLQYVLWFSRQRKRVGGLEAGSSHVEHASAWKVNRVWVGGGRSTCAGDLTTGSDSEVMNERC